MSARPSTSFILSNAEGGVKGLGMSGTIASNNLKIVELGSGA
jgi:hypothetical protein